MVRLDSHGLRWNTELSEQWAGVRVCARRATTGLCEEKHGRHVKLRIFSWLGSWKWIKDAWPARRLYVQEKNRDLMNTANELRHCSTDSWGLDILAGQIHLATPSRVRTPISRKEALCTEWSDQKLSCVGKHLANMHLYQKMEEKKKIPLPICSQTGGRQLYGTVYCCCFESCQPCYPFLWITDLWDLSCHFKIISCLLCAISRRTIELAIKIQSPLTLGHLSRETDHF